MIKKFFETSMNSVAKNNSASPSALGGLSCQNSSSCPSLTFAFFVFKYSSSSLRLFNLFVALNPRQNSGPPTLRRKFAQFTFCQKSSEIFKNIQKSTPEIDGNRQKLTKIGQALLLLARNQPIFTQIYQNIQKYSKIFS